MAANSSPVAFGYVDEPAIDEIVRAVTESEPLLSFTREDQVEQTVWEVPEAHTEELSERLGQRRLYIVDGHHRVSAGVENWRRSDYADNAGFVLAAMFPVSKLRVSAFHRRVADLNGLTARSLCDAIAAQDFSVRP